MLLAAVRDDLQKIHDKFINSDPSIIQPARLEQNPLFTLELFEVMNMTNEEDSENGMEQYNCDISKQNELKQVMSQAEEQVNLEVS